MPFYVYILRCSDGSYHLGHCSDLQNRIHEHNNGEAAKHTRERLPVELLYFEEFSTQLEAIRRELQLKGWSRAKKDALIRGDLTALKRASKRQG